MQQPWAEFIEQRLNDLQRGNRFRQRTATHQRQSEDAIDFSSNDYLGLRQHPSVLAAVCSAAEQFGWGSGASPVLTGHTTAHAELERALSQFFSSQESLLFSSGYATNVGALSCLSDEGCMVYSDALNHASLIDGLRLGRGERHIYPHLDLESLRKQLSDNRHRCARCLIVTETVFSMDGDRVNLLELLELASRFDCGVVIDEAHATGVYGRSGAGCLEELPPSKANDSPILCKLGTLSKSLGGIGGFATGSRSVIDYLVNHARSYLFSTSPPAVAAAAALAALQLLPALGQQRMQLRNRSEQLRQSLRDSGWQVPTGDSPIIPVIIGGAAETLRLSRQLREVGLLVPAIRPPTVPANTCRLRISLSTLHNDEQLQRLVDTMNAFRLA